MARDSPAEIHDDMIEAQQIAKKQGKIRFAGVSTHSGQQQLLPWMAQKGVFDVVLTAYNFTMDPAMEQAIAAAAKAGMGVVAMKVMAGGFRSLETRRSHSREARPARRHAGRAEVGHQQAQHRHHHSQHDGHGPVGREPEGHGAALSPGRRKSCWPRIWRSSSRSIAACAASAKAPARRGCRSPTCCASSPMPTATASSRWDASDSWSCPPSDCDARCGDCAECTVKCPHGVQVSEPHGARPGAVCMKACRFAAGHPAGCRDGRGAGLPQLPFCARLGTVRNEARSTPPTTSTTTRMAARKAT